MPFRVSAPATTIRTVPPQRGPGVTLLEARFHNARSGDFGGPFVVPAHVTLKLSVPKGVTPSGVAKVEVDRTTGWGKDLVVTVRAKGKPERGGARREVSLDIPAGVTRGNLRMVVRTDDDPPRLLLQRKIHVETR